jgi:hypothetical protein
MKIDSDGSTVVTLTMRHFPKYTERVVVLPGFGGMSMIRGPVLG